MQQPVLAPAPPHVAQDHAETALRAQLAAVMDSNRTEQQQQQQHHLPQSHPYQQIQPAVQQQQMPQGYADMQQSVSGHNIDPAIAGAHHALEMMNTDAGNSNAGGSGCESDQQQTIKQKKELASSKRAAQNRAAQRAFRARKETYIKALELKVRDYTAQQDTFRTIQEENFLLREYVIKLQHHILATGTSNDAPQPSALISDAIKYPRAPINIVSGEVQAPRPQDVHYQQHQQQHQQQQQLPLPQMDTRMSGMSLADTRQGSGQSMGGNASLSQDQARAMQAAMYPVQAVQALNEVTHQQIQQQRQAQQAQAAQEAQQQQAAIDEAERQRRELEAQALGAIHDETTIPSQRNEAFNQARMAAQTGSTPRSDSQSQSVSTPSQASQAFSPSSAQAQGMTMGQARSPEEELQRQLANLPPVPGDPSTNNGGPLPMPEL